MWGKTEAAAETISVWEESVTERSRDRKVTRELLSEKSRKVTSVRSPKSKGDNPRKGKAEKDEKVSDSTDSFLRARVLREAICQKTRDTFFSSVSYRLGNTQRLINKSCRESSSVARAYIHSVAARTAAVLIYTVFIFIYLPLFFSVETWRRRPAAAPTRARRATGRD